MLSLLTVIICGEVVNNAHSFTQQWQPQVITVVIYVPDEMLNGDRVVLDDELFFLLYAEIFLPIVVEYPKPKVKI